MVKLFHFGTKKCDSEHGPSRKIMKTISFLYNSESTQLQLFKDLWVVQEKSIVLDLFSGISLKFEEIFALLKLLALLQHGCNANQNTNNSEDLCFVMINSQRKNKTFQSIRFHIFIAVYCSIVRGLISD